ncbi:protein phosphatase 2C domain-containing protein [Lyngbya sp. CCY1209]|uniref:protein phosphatase 2C domain-containing protein n=1 Tax=Lyngbya sp. CCY1209 TaxID=2886103 RepID=UPI002D2001EF|nr:protein phosphatase 2C domain-containing protein [Lyngbya sp. CCY1209]MEB3883938.1 protein phosphatase 2C domain-containing protein [Lyngbya sp. CCY1209]
MSLDKLFQISSSSPPPIYCTNPACPQPRNALGQSRCVTCETPLTYRYLWAVGSAAREMKPGQIVGNRYYVTAPQIWLETKPAVPPVLPDRLSDAIGNYLYLYPHKLHLPNLYGIYTRATSPETADILLLDNVPVNDKGNLHPSLVESWPQATAVRQVYWLWQMWSLWDPLSEQGAAYSLLIKDNLRVDGWRLRLRELHRGKIQPTLPDLAESWSAFVETAHENLRSPLQDILQRLRQSPEGSGPGAIADHLNEILLHSAARLPLHLATAGQTDVGRMRSHNEDCCYPTAADLKQQEIYPNDKLIPHLSLVCDGVAGHEGGEVASQLAVQSIKPLIHSLMLEIGEQQTPQPPHLVAHQLQEITRVVNNVIAAQNDEQGRSSKQRMGTTLVMALQLCQRVQIEGRSDFNNAHELYIVNIGDSRAYWITSESCELLTVDDDVATREVRTGRALYWDAKQRRDAGALTQALGTREAEFLKPAVKRLIVESDGLLLLCSDGLSDNGWVEKTWADYAPAVLRGEKSLESAVRDLVEIANLHNGHDNISVVLNYFGVSPQKLVLVEPPEPPQKPQPLESEFTAASRALMEEDSATLAGKATRRRRSQKLAWILLIIGLLIAAIAGSFWIGWQNRDRDPVFPQDSAKMDNEK